MLPEYLANRSRTHSNHDVCSSHRISLKARPPTKKVDFCQSFRFLLIVYVIEHHFRYRTHYNLFCLRRIWTVVQRFPWKPLRKPLLKKNNFSQYFHLCLRISICNKTIYIFIWVHKELKMSLITSENKTNKYWMKSDKMHSESILRFSANQVFTLRFRASQISSPLWNLENSGLF